MLQTIEKALDQFPRREHRLAQWVLKHAIQVPDLSIKDFANAANVSEPTVVRFCQRIKCKGYRDFKIKLAGSLARGERLMQARPANPIIGRESILQHDCETLIKKVFETTPSKQLHEFIIKLAAAKQALIVYDRASQALAELAYHALYPLLRNIQKAPLSNNWPAGASLLSRNDIVIAFQQSDSELFETLTSAKTKKAHICVIGKATADTPIDIFLGGDTDANDIPLGVELAGLTAINRIASLLPIISEPAQRRLTHFGKIQKTSPKPKMLQGELW